MFDIGWSELMVIGVVALIAIGPKELPGVLRMVGQWMGKARKLAGEFQGQFQEAMREAEMADLKKSFDEVKSAASGFADNNVLTSLQKDVDAAMTVDKIQNIDTPPEVPTTPEPPTAETLAAEALAAETLAATEAHAMQHAVTEPLAILPPAAAAEPAAPEAVDVAAGTADNAAADKDAKAS
jgi:sec-independent protein translocase protein TatB